MENVYWHVDQQAVTDIKPIQAHFGLSPVLAELLVKRGYDTIESVAYFLSAAKEDLHDPFQLLHMQKAVTRIEDAIQRDEKIVIYGDYDVDGITSTSLLMKALGHLKAHVDFYLPDRMEEGYGINCDAIKKIASDGVKLIISVDCGISAIEPAKLAKELGVDLIITDHHECQETLPDAFAIINPKQPECPYSEKMLAGAGIALKLAQAVMADAFSEIVSDLMALAALGTIADLAPLKGENRLIAKLGLAAINTHVSKGIDALVACAGIKSEAITAGHVGFQIGPRLNASGRLDRAHVAVELLTSDDAVFCGQVASDLNGLNQSRQSIEADMVERCIALVEKDWLTRKPKIIVLKDPDFHVGVVGIAASRLVERYHRPVILLSEEEGILKGSARSVGDFNIFEAIRWTESHLIHFGGHKQAAGLKLESAHYDAFLADLGDYVERTITDKDLMRQIRIDQALEPQEVTLAFADQLSLLEPYGMGNPKPVFAMNHLMLEGVQWLGADKNHVKLVLNHQYRLFEAIQFRTLFKPADFQLHSAVDLAFYVEKNQFRAVETLQLHIKDIRFKSLEQQLTNDLILAYCSRFLDDLSTGELQVLDKKELKAFNVTERPRVDLEAPFSQTDTGVTLLFHAYSAVELYYLGNGTATPWLSLLKGSDGHRILMCPEVDTLNLVDGASLVIMDAPLDKERLQWLSERKHPLYLDLHQLKQQMVLLDKLTIERSALGDMFKKAQATFTFEAFDYRQWMSLFENDQLLAIIALRLFVDGGILEVQSDQFTFKHKPEKFNLYDLQLMKNMKNYRINLSVAIEYCEGNKLL